jgi:cobalt-zinc-cadmium efflux system outer membrane protein
MTHLFLTVLLLIPVTLVSGCAAVRPDAGFEEVQKMAIKSGDYRLFWSKDSTGDPAVDTMVDQLISTPLTIDAAVQIALLNNPALQATFEDLGVSQADLVEAGLLKNPVFFGQARFPEGGVGNLNLEFDLALELLNILMRPARRQLAAEQLVQTQLRVAEEVVVLASEVRTGWYETAGAHMFVDLQRQITQASRLSYKMALRMHAAGNQSALNLAIERSAYEQSKIFLADAEKYLFSTRERLTRLMGLWGPRTQWKLSGKLPDIPPDDPPLTRLESHAIVNRLDLAVARKEAEILARALGITIDWRWFASAEVGINAERETDGQWITGPNLTFELPLFNQHQADIARLEARLRRSQKQLAALAVDIRSEVRALRNELVTARRRVDHYRGVMVPLHEKIVKLTQEEYNYMLTGVFDLLTAKKQEYDAYRQYIDAVRDYWIVRTNLERTLGGRLPAATAAAPTRGTLAPPESETAIPRPAGVRGKPDAKTERPSSPHHH